MTLPPDSIGRGLAPVSITLDTRTEGVTKRDGSFFSGRGTRRSLPMRVGALGW